MHSARHKFKHGLLVQIYVQRHTQNACAFDGGAGGCAGWAYGCAQTGHPWVYRRAVAKYVPTIRRRRLGAELRRVREEAGLTTTEVGAQLGWSHSKVSRIETSKAPVNAADVGRMITYYAIAGDESAELMTLAREARQRGWWQNYSEVLPDWFESYLGFESEACRISTFQPQVIPGLLQTEEYAAAVLGAHPQQMTPDEVEWAVALRRARQTMLTNASEPIHLDAVIGEGALRQMIGGADVTRDQLQWLVEQAQLPNITLRALQFDAGAHPALHGAFTVLEFPDSADPRIVYLDNLTDGLYLESLREVGLYRLGYKQLRDIALQPDETVILIARLIEEIRHYEHIPRNTPVEGCAVAQERLQREHR
jgi:transcriptional regulator with XRE-family HTH domain